MASLLVAAISSFLPGPLSATGASARGHATAAPLHVETAYTVQREGPVASLYGILYPKGHYAHYWFQYGRTDRYGHMTKPELDEGFQVFGSELVSEIVLHLRSHTLYHFRIVGKNAAGKVYGADGTFRTKGRGSS